MNGGSAGLGVTVRGITINAAYLECLRRRLSWREISNYQELRNAP